MEGEQPIPCRPQWPQGLAPDQQYQGPPGVSSTPFQSAPYTPHQGYGNNPNGEYQAPCQQYRGPLGTASAHTSPTAYAPSQGYGNHLFGQYHTPTTPLPNIYKSFPPPTLYSGFTTPMGYPPIPSAEYQLYALDASEYAPFPRLMASHPFGLPNYATSAPRIALGPTPFTFASHPALQAPTVEARSEPVSGGHQNANGQARQDDQITRFFTGLVEKEANRAEKDRKIEERIKRLEECNKVKEKESAMLKALLSQGQRRLRFANADDSAREPTAQAKSNNHPSEPVGSPMASNDTTNNGSRKRRRSIIKRESDDDHEEFDSSALGKGKKRLQN